MNAVLEDTSVFSSSPVVPQATPRHCLYEIRNSDTFAAAKLVKKMESMQFPPEYKDASLVVKSSLPYRTKAKLFQNFAQLSRRSKAPGTLGHALVASSLSAAEALAAARFVEEEQERVLFDKIPAGNYCLTPENLEVFSLDSLFRILSYSSRVSIAISDAAMELVLRKSSGCLGASMAEKLYPKSAAGSRSRLVLALIAFPENPTLLQENIDEILRVGKDELSEIFVGSSTNGNLFPTRMRRAIRAAFSAQENLTEAKVFILSELFDSGATFDTLEDALELI